MCITCTTGSTASGIDIVQCIPNCKERQGN